MHDVFAGTTHLARVAVVSNLGIAHRVLKLHSVPGETTPVSRVIETAKLIDGTHFWCV